jgi:hypothetical protein
MTKFAASAPAIDRSATRARVMLALFFAVTAFFIAITFSPLRSGFADAPDRGPGDVDLYRAEVARVRAGESYYDAAAAELRARGYPTRSLFNWRAPLPVWLIGNLPDVGFSKCLLGFLGLVLCVMSFQLLADEGSVKQGLLGVLLLAGALLPCVLGDLLVMSELWSGVLIAVSAVCLGLNRRTAGVTAGVAALLFRELAAPYCLVCVALALADRRWRELAGWSTGFAAYAVFVGLHVAHVLPRISPADVAHADGWVRFGGTGFVISTVQMNGFLLLVPQWVAAVYLGCVLLGAATWNSPAGQRIALTVAAYAIAFSIVGHDFNQYWGSLTAPLFCLSACRAPSAIRQLWRTAGLAASPPQVLWGDP